MKVSPLSKFLSDVLLENVIPTLASLNTPTSLTVFVPVTVNVFTNCNVSLVVVVVVLVTVAAALSKRPSVNSVSRVVSVAVAAVDAEPTARYVNAVGEPVLPTSPAISV